MNENNKRCMGCMAVIDATDSICPVCGYNTLSVRHTPYLPLNALLMNRYTVGKVLGTSADKATYLGFDIKENKTVKIHEFLPQSLIIREPDEESVTVRVNYEKLYYDCLDSFQSMWSTLSEINLPAFDKVYDVFYLNNTVYSVCEYTECITLKEYFNTREKLLSWQKACSAFRPIMNVLYSFHRLGIIHGELSPTSVYVGNDGKIRLSDVCIPQSHGIISEVSVEPSIGYASLERCKMCSSLTAASDIYSLMALIYTAVTGFVPPPATARLSEDTLMLPNVVESSMTRDAVKVFFDAIKVNASERTNSIEKLIIALAASLKDTSEQSTPEETAKHTEEAKSEPVAPVKKEESTKTSVIFFKSFVTAIVVIVIVFVTMYATILYDYMNIPLLNNALSSFSFLPINITKEDNNVTTTQESEYSKESETTQNVKTVTVADFKTLRYQDIKQNAVFNNNFNIIYEFEYSDEYAENEVISQSIPFGETVNVGSTLTIVISKGKEAKVLKDVIGMNFDDAKAVLEDDGFIVKKKLLENDGAQTPDEVFIMSHVAGLEFEKGTEITLSVWDKIEETKSVSNESTESET